VDEDHAVRLLSQVTSLLKFSDDPICIFGLPVSFGMVQGLVSIVLTGFVASVNRIELT